MEKDRNNTNPNGDERHDKPHPLLKFIKYTHRALHALCAPLVRFVSLVTSWLR